VAAGLLYVFGWLGESGPLWFDAAGFLLAFLPACWVGWEMLRSREETVGILLSIQLGITTISALTILAASASSIGLEAFAVVYFALAFLVTFQARLPGAVAIAWALALIWGHAVVAEGGFVTGEFDSASVAWQLAITRSLFVGAFGFLSAAVHGAEVLERRKRHRQEVEEEREEMIRQAREYRLLSTRRTDAPADRAEATELITREAVDAVNHAIYQSLSLLKTGLGAHTCVLLWMDVRAEEMRIKELVSESDAIIESTLRPERGVIGGITRRREPVVMRDLRPGFRGVAYYRDPQDITDFLGVPVLEDGHLRGVLCVDRRDNRPFTEDDIELVEETSRYLLRAVVNERVFATIERSKYELSRFFDASRRLNSVLTPSEVYEVALEVAYDVAPFDLAAITLFDESCDRHTVAAVDDRMKTGAEAWTTRIFDSNAGLVSMVVKNAHYLPFGGVVRDRKPVVFTADESFEGMESMLVLPLVVQDAVIGTFVVAAKAAQRYTNERREMLEVVANQVAVTLQNARLYAQMESMATTDGLTGLANHRTFQQRLDEAIARARRSKKKFTLLLTDIDHFKSVNDTYGHPVGDEVLRKVAATFEANLRETDIPARYGGEEFAIILEDTDVEGADVIANRLRTELKKLVFQTDQGPFSRTMSIGMAEWPTDATDKQELIDLTDQALYHSKENGRDRVTAFGAIARRTA
jgi:diguanylate cyclase (GGDEF)-like protein